MDPEQDTKEISIAALSLEELVRNVANVKQQVNLCKDLADDLAMELAMAKDSILGRILSQRENAKTFMDLDKNYKFRTEIDVNGAPIPVEVELRGADHESWVYDDATTKQVNDLLESRRAIDDEIALVKAKGKKTLEGTTRTYSLYLNDVKEKKSRAKSTQNSPHKL